MRNLLFFIVRFFLLIPKFYYSIVIVGFHTTIFYAKCKLFYPKIHIGKNVILYGKMHFRVGRTSEVFIGDDVIFRSNNRYNPIGINRPVSIIVKEGALLSIGTHTALSGTAIFVQTEIKIGEWVNFGANTNVWDTDFHPLGKTERRKSIIGAKSKKIIIGDDAFIGANAIVLKGSIIGSGAIIGAGSVISGTIPKDEIWAGNPAQFIRKNTDD